jgi:hypothetical protein
MRTSRTKSANMAKYGKIEHSCKYVQKFSLKPLKLVYLYNVSFLVETFVVLELKIRLLKLEHHALCGGNVELTFAPTGNASCVSLLVSQKL